MNCATNIIKGAGQAYRLSKQRGRAVLTSLFVSTAERNNSKNNRILTVFYIFLLGAVFLYFRFEQHKLNVDSQDFKNNINLTLAKLPRYYINTRHGILLQQLSTVDNTDVIIFGDSIVEQIDFPPLGPIKVFNAGVGGTRATESGEFFAAVLDRSMSRLMVLSVGTNDAFRKFDVTPEAFSRSYDALVQAALDRKIPIVLASIPPLDESQKLSQLFDPKRIEAFNECILAIGRKHGLTVVDVNSLILGKIAERHDGFSLDGVHLNGTYSRFWRKAIYAAVRTALIAQPPTQKPDGPF